jgi:glyoxylase-like metal-dependent hydrolase (beta-lactamase superfamily II)
MRAPTRFPLGDATISVLHIGDLRVRLADWLRLDESAWPEEHRSLFTDPVTVPVQCLHIALPGRSVLVDACHPELLVHTGEAVADGPPAAGLLDQLAAIGVNPAGIDTLVITHPHFDHYCGAIAVGETPEDDRLLFPNARHLVGRADWDGLQDALKSPASPVSRVFGLADRHGLVEAVEGQRDLGDGVSIVPTPGETPGHQAVRVESAGESLYMLGDLYHHLVEVERPEWGVHWADAAATAKSREALTTAALAEEALLVATHIPGVGRLCRTPSGLRWETHTLPA